VDEQNLKADESGDAIRNPDADLWFESLRDGAYIRHLPPN
jgi:heat shock protein HspQ